MHVKPYTLAHAHSYSSWILEILQ